MKYNTILVIFGIITLLSTTSTFFAQQNIENEEQILEKKLDYLRHKRTLKDQEIEEFKQAISSANSSVLEKLYNKIQYWLQICQKNIYLVQTEQKQPSSQGSVFLLESATTKADFYKKILEIISQQINN